MIIHTHNQNHHHNSHHSPHHNRMNKSGTGGGGGPEDANRPKDTLIKDLKPGSKHLNMLVIILDISKMTKTKDGHEIRSVKVADKSGSINLTVWDKPGTLLQPGDIIRLQKAYCNLFKNSLTLYIGKGGELVRVGDFCLVFSETPNLSEKILPAPSLPPPQAQAQSLLPMPNPAIANNINLPGSGADEPSLKH